MRSWTFSRASLGLVVAGLLCAGGSSPEPSSEATNSAAIASLDPNAAAPQPEAEPAAAAENPAEEFELADAAFQPISAGKPLPPNLKLTGPVAEIAKLVESGVEERVMLAYVTNSMSAFNLGVEEIIYLNDIGVPGTVVAAMIQRDEALKELSPEPAGPYAPQPAEATVPPEETPEAAPPPAEMASDPVFYDSLAPYGTWVNVAGWGPCWQPTVVIANPAWRPYCDGGRWIYSDCGWYWLSGYSWGWAPFHYGRWFQHRRMGWCWAPDRIWGPSWVCWRYSGSHCGWAPLPPRASFSIGVGLAYRGHPVGSTFGFGLGVGSFTFVEASHFRDRHLNRHALPPPHAARVFHEAPPSTSIIGNSGRVINQGIPPSRIAQATRSEVPRVTIRSVNHAAGRGSRGERFEGNSRTLSVYRPQFPSTAGTMTGSAGRPRSEVRPGGSTAAPAPATQRVVPARSPQVGGSTTIAQPNASTPALTMPQRRTTFSPAPATTRPAPAPTVSNPSRDTARKPAQPLILHGPDRSERGAASGSVSTRNWSAPRQTPTLPNRREVSPPPTVSQPFAPVAEAPRSQSPSPQRNTVQRPATSVRQQPSTAPAWSIPTRSTPPRSSSRAAPVPARSERPRPFVIPSSPAPAQAPRSAPTPTFAAPRSTPARAPTPGRSMPAPSFAPARSAPTPSFTPPPTRSVSPPTVSPRPQAPAMQSRPAHSTPSARAASPPSGPGRSSSGPRGR